MKKLLIKIFEWTYKIGKMLLLVSENRIIDIMFIIGITLPILYKMFDMPRFLLLVSIGLIMSSVIIGNCKKYLLSISGFLGMGLLYWIMISIAILIFITSVVHINFVFWDIIIWHIIFAVTWCIYGLLANNKVAINANLMLSTLFGIIIIIKDNIISLVPDYMLNDVCIEGYTNEKMVEIIFNLIFTPILITNLVATMFCALKGYWIEKYNNNKDISWSTMEGNAEELTENEFE